MAININDAILSSPLPSSTAFVGKHDDQLHQCHHSHGHMSVLASEFTGNLNVCFAACLRQEHLRITLLVLREGNPSAFSQNVSSIYV